MFSKCCEKFIKFLFESVITGGRIAVKKGECDWHMKNLEHHLLGKHPRIGFAEGANPDVIRAAIRHVENGFILPVLIGHKRKFSGMRRSLALISAVWKSQIWKALRIRRKWCHAC